MTMRLVGFSVFCFILAAFFVVGNASAQISTQARPAISPWVMMGSQTRGGPGSNYLDFVKPRQEMFQAYESQQRQLMQQATTQRTMQQAMQQGVGGTGQALNDGSADRILAEPKKVRSIGGMQGAGYRQYLHFYPRGLQQGGVPNFATGRRY